MQKNAFQQKSRINKYFLFGNCRIRKIVKCKIIITSCKKPELQIRLILVANNQLNNMSNIYCVGCGAHISSFYSLIIELGFTLYSNGLNYMKATYKLIEIKGKDSQVAELNSQIEVLQAKIKAMEEENYSEYFRGNVLGNIIEKQSAEFMQKFNTYVSKVNSSQESLRKFVESSRNQTKVKMQYQIQNILVSEAQYLINSAKAQGKDNTQRILSCEVQRQKMRKEMSNQTLPSPHKGQNSESNKTTYKYSRKLIQNIMDAYQDEIKEMKKKSVVISELVQDGEEMIRKLDSEVGKSKKNASIVSKMAEKTEATREIIGEVGLFS